MAELPRLDRDDLILRDDWGIRYEPALPWLIRPRIKVLVVIDGGIDLSTTGFGLGLLLDVLRDTSFGWWVRFGVDVAQRDTGTPTVVADPGDYDVKYQSFRFDMDGFDLDDYDQVWCFGFNPGNDGSSNDDNIYQSSQSPLSDDELLLLAEWMEAGGGVFATGDHHYLGASMCSRIPRVRTMRRWTNAQGVPPIGGTTRLDTNQPASEDEENNAEYMPFGRQGDEVPQPIEVVKQPLRAPFALGYRRYAPHPILCTPDGVIDVFPDHPHEGEVIPDEEVELDEPLDIPGYDKDEYPGGTGRPTPQVIAHGRTTHEQTNRVKGAVDEKRFGLIGVYDGEDAGVGRVVVDSTWHHWFSENLVGFKASNPSVWSLMQYYFRNVGLWLATPAQRSRMLLAASWGVVVGSGPMEFPITSPVWDLGERALDVIGRTASQCTMHEWLRDFIDLERLPDLTRVPEPCLSCPPPELLERYLLGGVARGLADVAFSYQEIEAKGGRAELEPERIAAAATEGVRRAQEDLARDLRDNAEAVMGLSDAVTESARELTFEPPELGRRRVRVNVDMIQMPDPADPALIDDTVDVALRILVDRHVASAEVMRELRLPEPDRRGLVVETGGTEGAEITVWEGCSLEVSVAASADASGPRPAPRDLRGEVRLTGDPESWLGRTVATGDRDDAWRMWLRIETVD